MLVDFLCLSNSIIDMKFISFFFFLGVVLWIKPKTLCMLAKYSAGKLHPQPQVLTFEVSILLVFSMFRVTSYHHCHFQAVLSLTEQQSVSPPVLTPW